VTIMVAAGLPVKFATRIRSVCDVTLARHLVALVFNRIPTPPVQALRLRNKRQTDDFAIRVLA